MKILHKNKWLTNLEFTHGRQVNSMPEYAEWVSALSDRHHWYNRTLTRTVESHNGCINDSGRLSDPTADTLSPHHPMFHKVIEPGIRDLLWITCLATKQCTYTSCEGHIDSPDFRRHIGFCYNSNLIHTLARSVYRAKNTLQDFPVNAALSMGSLRIPKSRNIPTCDLYLVPKHGVSRKEYFTSLSAATVKLAHLISEDSLIVSYSETPASDYYGFGGSYAMVSPYYLNFPANTLKSNPCVPVPQRITSLHERSDISQGSRRISEEKLFLESLLEILPLLKRKNFSFLDLGSGIGRFSHMVASEQHFCLRACIEKDINLYKYGSLKYGDHWIHSAIEDYSISCGVQFDFALLAYEILNQYSENLVKEIFSAVANIVSRGGILVADSRTQSQESKLSPPARTYFTWNGSLLSEGPHFLNDRPVRTGQMLKRVVTCHPLGGGDQPIHFESVVHVHQAHNLVAAAASAGWSLVSARDLFTASDAGQDTADIVTQFVWIKR